MKLAIDLFCGLGGWTEGLQAEGFDVVGFDIERRPYPAQLVLQDVMTIDGKQFKDATVIVASPPCQEYSYRAMPWKRAKALPPPSSALFHACFRIQAEASAAAGKHIPLVVENVRGAQKWVGRAHWHFGSFYLWGDLPPLMPSSNAVKVSNGMFKRSGYSHTRHLTAPREHIAISRVGFNVAAARQYREGVKGSEDQLGGDRRTWFDGGLTKFGSKSDSRKLASAQIAKIPVRLSRHIARYYATGSV